MGDVPQGRFQDGGSGREKKKGERKKGTPTVSWQTALAGTSTGSGSQSGIEARHQCRSPQRTGGTAGRLQGGRGGWCPEHRPVPRAVAVARGCICPQAGARGRSHPCDDASESSGRSSRGGENSSIIDCSPPRLEQPRDFAVKADLPPTVLWARAKGHPRVG